MKAWLKDGKVIMSGGKVVLCDTCPCEQPGNTCDDALPIGFGTFGPYTLPASGQLWFDISSTAGGTRHRIFTADPEDGSTNYRESRGDCSSLVDNESDNLSGVCRPVISTSTYVRILEQNGIEREVTLTVESGTCP